MMPIKLFAAFAALSLAAAGAGHAQKLDVKTQDVLKSKTTVQNVGSQTKVGTKLPSTGKVGIKVKKSPL